MNPRASHLIPSYSFLFNWCQDYAERFCCFECSINGYFYEPPYSMLFIFFTGFFFFSLCFMLTCERVNGLTFCRNVTTILLLLLLRNVTLSYFVVLGMFCFRLSATVVATTQRFFWIPHFFCG